MDEDAQQVGQANHADQTDRADQPEPFDGLSLAAVDWAQLTHAYGSASDLPDFLRALMSEDAVARRSAMDELISSINHQGSVYDASAYAVPFLAQAALHAPGDRAAAVFLMAAMCCGGFAMGAVDPATDSGAVTVEVCRVLPSLAPLLRDPGAEVRRGILRILTACGPERARELVDLRVVEDEDSLVRADVLAALTRLEPDWPDLRDRLEGALADPAPAVRQVAAATLLTVDGPQLDPEVVDVLADTVAVAGDLTEEYGGGPSWGPLPLPDGSFADEAANALASLDPDPDAKLRAARRITAARTGHSWLGSHLAREVADTWRDREREAIRIVVGHLADAGSAARRPGAELQAVARMAGRIGTPDPAYAATVRPWVDHDNPSTAAAALSALARLRDESALESAERALFGDVWPGSAIRDVCEAFGGRAAVLIPLLRRHLLAEERAVPRIELRFQNQVIEVCGALRAVGAPAAEAVPELIALLGRGRNTAAVLWTLAEAGPAIGDKSVAAAAADAIVQVVGRLRSQPEGVAAAAAHRAVSGEEWLAVDIVRRIADGGYLDDFTPQQLGRLGPTAVDCVPLLTKLMDGPKTWPSVRAARAYWQITGDARRPIALLARHVAATPLGLFAVSALLEMRRCPDEVLRTLHHLADAPQRLIPHSSSGQVSGQHDDDTLRDRARALLALHCGAEEPASRDC
ncbi:MAG TPA: HEAT repeat domain-containing protein [Actinocrinis sp.]|nr:HEAT repeat domain-containing protein [Actinocrinis sp.]